MPAAVRYELCDRLGVKDGVLADSSCPKGDNPKISTERWTGPRTSLSASRALDRNQRLRTTFEGRQEFRSVLIRPHLLPPLLCECELCGAPWRAAPRDHAVRRRRQGSPWVAPGIAHPRLELDRELFAAAISPWRQA